MKTVKKSGGTLFAGLMLLCVLTACHVNPNPLDMIANDKVNRGKEAEIMPGITEQQPQDIIVPPEQVGALGERIQGIDIQNGKVIPNALAYTVNKATIFEDITKAGIEESAMTPFVSSSLQDEIGKLLPSVKLLLIELTVQNVRAEPDRNITSFEILCADTDTMSSSSAETSFFELFPSEPAYFSNPTGKRVGDEWKDYFYYKLPVGQSKNIKVGWYVDTEQYDPGNLYFIFNRYYDEYVKFVKLDV